ncbi:LysE family translocator [Roseibium aggregatum]|jgi:threonine/homoserine/homoserine lactone efflux protein|uniref:Lysine exporter protein (LYSE/YGGA) n=1 Tax=Roseibium aggregatum (strain ATCC 25650 / DSM 13394 / JCM 20685 / NBRC 16684 / NCIMB 2208 / IAM 12614 / B1) TaxID=384765 RepID=A0NPV1_ROSAI|nr:LysE family translocator [Roseibium aggregatum]EAV45464.1 Lysine exporter protein (LYSE/YGGA) [Roseibium aggregatum IAM 12614]
MPIDLWLLFIAVSLLPAVSPGPAVMLAISNTLRFGRNATLASAAGNATGLVILGYAVALGFGALMAASAVAFTVLKIIGAAYLIFIGIKIWRDKSAFHVEDGVLIARKSPRKLFLEALLVSITNPKAILVITALFPQFMRADGIDLMEISVLSFTYAALCFANHAAIAYAGGHMRRFLTSAKRMLWVRRVTGTLFVGFGAALAAASR